MKLKLVLVILFTMIFTSFIEAKENKKENKKVEDDLTENVGKGHFKIKTETRFRKVSVFFS